MHTAFRRVFKVNPLNTTTHPFKKGTIDQNVYNVSIIRNIIKDIPRAAVFATIFAGYFTYLPYTVKWTSNFLHNVPVDQPQVIFEDGHAVVNIPTQHVKLDKHD